MSHPRTRARAAEHQHDLLPNGLKEDAHELLRAIARELDYRHWQIDTLERITRRLREAGYDIREPQEVPHGG